jgi:hypothetical protein
MHEYRLENKVLAQKTIPKKKNGLGARHATELDMELHIRKSI